MDTARLEQWLVAKNQEYRKQDIPQPQRPWLACRDFSLEFKTDLVFGSVEAEAIFDWFEKNSKPGAQHIGCLFEAVYFFDATFWEVNVPIFYGRNKINLWTFLVMPPSTRAALMSDSREVREYACCATDALDYALGIDIILHNGSTSQLAKSLSSNANSYLRSSAQTLRARRPDRSVVQNARLAGEIALKALLCSRYNHDEASMKGFGHNLDRLLEEVVRLTGDQFLDQMRGYLPIFPPIHDRYTGETTDGRFLWNCFRLALALSASFTRITTGIDNRHQLQNQTSI